MTIEVLTQPFSVCKTRSFPKKFFERGFCFLARTDHEISVVCETKEAPSDVSARQDGWRALRIQGTLAFALTGILAGISAVLAQRQISIFAVSTYDTDYVLVRENQLQEAVEALRAAIGRWKIGKIGMTGKTGCSAPLLILRRAVTGVLPGRTVFIEEALLQAPGICDIIISTWKYIKGVFTMEQERNPLPAASPESVGLDSEIILQYLKKLEEEGHCLHGFTIIRHGKIAAEGYYAPQKPQWKHRMYSTSKSFVSVAIGMLQDEGKLSIQDKIAGYFPEKLPEKLHPYIADASIRDLLMMSTPFHTSTYTMCLNPEQDWIRSFFECPPRTGRDRFFLMIHRQPRF